MLTKRTNILFDQELWNQLVQLSKANNKSVGELVRTAVKDTYAAKDRQKNVKNAVDAIRAFREQYGKKPAKGEDSVSIIRRMRKERTKHLMQLLENHK